MKNILIFLIIAIIFGICVGFLVKNTGNEYGEITIGLVVTFTFVFIPFIYYKINNSKLMDKL